VLIHGNVELLSQLERLLPAPVPATYRPGVYSERSDHPLDKGYDMHRQVLVPPLSACCVLRLDGMVRDGASFRFAARGYDVYRTRVLGMLHAYDTGEGVPWERLTLCLDWFGPNVFRLRCARGEEVPEHPTPMVPGPAAREPFEPACSEHEDRYEFASGELRLAIHRGDFRIEVRGADGGPVTVIGARQKDGFANVVDTLPLGFVTDRETGRVFAVAGFELAPGEAVFGFGEHFGTVNKRGQTVSLWNEEGMGHATGRNYKNVPFFMSTAGYGVFVNESLPMTFFVGSRFYPRHEVAVEGDLLDAYFFYGPSLKRVQTAYTGLTGRAPMVPRWSLGLWVSRISYRSQEEVLETARRLRGEGWPADVIHVDTGWFEKEWQCDWRFDPRRFPDPEAMIRELHAAGLRLCLWQWPYVVSSLPLREEAERRGALAQGEVTNMGLGLRHIDFTCPEGVAWYQEQLARLFALGVDAVKTDFGEYVEDHLRFRNAEARSLRNLYALLYQRAAFEAAERARPGQALLWARSACAGSQRYPVHWSGDSACTFDDMLCALRGGLCLGLSGFTFWSNDVGGFSGAPSDELYARWTAWSIFNSHVRLHGGPPRYREPWNYAPETQAAFRKLLGLRYRLLPYLESEARKSARQGLPVLRHLVFEFQEDPTSWNVEDQFLFGAAVLVAPILTEHPARRVWIPPGVWYDAASGEAVQGPAWTRVTAGLDRVPLYDRGGHGVAMGPAIRFVDEPAAAGPLTLKLFPDAAGRAGMVLEGERGAVSTRLEVRGGQARVDLKGPPGEYVVEVHGGAGAGGLRVNGEEVPAAGTGEGSVRGPFRLGPAGRPPRSQR